MCVLNEYAILIHPGWRLAKWTRKDELAMTSSPGQEVRRLNINLPEPVFQELQQLSASTGRSMTELVRTALGLVNVAYTETDRSHVLAVADKDGKLLKQLVIPR